MEYMIHHIREVLTAVDQGDIKDQETTTLCLLNPHTVKV